MFDYFYENEHLTNELVLDQLNLHWKNTIIPFFLDCLYSFFALLLLNNNVAVDLII